MGHIPNIPCGISWVLDPTSMYYVPAFFILSGYLLNVKRPPKDFLQNKTFVIPLFKAYLYKLLGKEKNKAI